MKNKFISVAITIASILGLSSCDNSLVLPIPPTQDSTINVVKTPDVMAYSGNQTFGGTIYTRSASQPDVTIKVQDNQEKGEWMLQQDYWKGYYKALDNAPQTTDRGESVSQSEYDYVMEYLQKHPNEGYNEVDLTTYFLQNVGSAGHTYTTTPDQNGVTHTTGMQMDYFEINGWHVNDYNAQGGPRIYVENWSLENCAYHDSFGNNTFNYYKFYYIPMEDGTYNLYLCFDYATISGQGNVSPDGTYDDWVIKIVPADGAKLTPPANNDEDKPVVTPDDTSKTTEHVEINLSIEERPNIEWLTSHLSIHVRANTNVEVFIPLPAKYYCAVDDLEIVNKHDIEFLYGKDSKVQSYYINGNELTLTVSFEMNGIRVNTYGINEDVIDYCQENYGDGLTFEVWNYMNLKVRDWNTGQDILGYGQENEIRINELRDLLNQSTVLFTPNIPSLYVNAFNKTEDGSKFIDDCTVQPAQPEFLDFEVGHWYNNSPYNELYFRKD